MSVSGVKCTQAVVDKYNEFKRLTSNIEYVVAKIDNGYIVLDEHPERTAASAEDTQQIYRGEKIPAGFKKLEQKCVDSGCAYAFYLFQWISNSTGGLVDTVVFIQYCDDTASSKLKMAYSTSGSALRRNCNGIGIVVEANDRDEIDYFEILERCRKSKR